MNINRFTEKAQEAVIASQHIAEGLNHPQIEPEHLLVALVEHAGGVVPEVLRKMNADPAQVGRDVRAALATLPQAYGADLRLLDGRRGDRVGARLGRLRA